ncbi:MAG: enoyl-CoA hydratase-related protein, partial [Pseudolabrys sp.]
MTYQNIVVEAKGRVGIIRLNRPQALNALNKALIDELTKVVDAFDADDKIGCMLITGNEKAFAAGADIKEMAERGPFDELIQERLAYRDQINRVGKPMIAA